MAETAQLEDAVSELVCVEQKSAIPSKLALLIKDHVSSAGSFTCCVVICVGDDMAYVLIEGRQQTDESRIVWAPIEASTNLDLLDKIMKRHALPDMTYRIVSLENWEKQEYYKSYLRMTDEELRKAGL